MTPCLSGDMLAEPGFDDGGVLSTAAVDALHVPHHLGLLEDQRLRQNRVEMVTQNLPGTKEYTTGHPYTLL